MGTHCEGTENDNGQVEECLKMKFTELGSIECQRHVAMLITAVQVDIHTDPILHRACAIDLVSYCKEIPPGEGRSEKLIL